MLYTFSHFIGHCRHFQNKTASNVQIFLLLLHCSCGWLQSAADVSLNLTMLHGAFKENYIEPQPPRLFVKGNFNWVCFFSFLSFRSFYLHFPFKILSISEEVLDSLKVCDDSRVQIHSRASSKPKSQPWGKCWVSEAHHHQTRLEEGKPQDKLRLTVSACLLSRGDNLHNKSGIMGPYQKLSHRRQRIA